MAQRCFQTLRVYNGKLALKLSKTNETLKKQCDDLIVKLNQTEFIATTYKRGLATVEDQLITYRKKNEVLFSKEVAVLKRELACKDYEINVLKNDSKENSDDSLVKEQVSKDTSSFVESSLNVDKETIFPIDKKNDTEFVDSGCSRHMTGSITYLSDFKEFDRGYVTFGEEYMVVEFMCKKQTVVATSTTEAEYVAAASCCGQVLWIQNQLLDYGYNFMNTVINIDNNSTICIIENPVQHSKTKHIEIRHHFIRDCNAKKLIQMVKIHTDHNVADLLTKGFDAGRFQYLVSSIGMLNP
ncbi:hypothetical protein Tco_1204821 [Tanacetum coccineum]